MKPLETRSNHIELYGARPDNYEITYIMHNQQPWVKRSDKPCLVTYNPISPIDSEKIIGRWWFQHIVHDVRHIAWLVHLFHFIQGKRRTWHCGAHTLVNSQETCLATGLATAKQIDWNTPQEHYRTFRIAAVSDPNCCNKNYRVESGLNEHHGVIGNKVT